MSPDAFNVEVGRRLRARRRECRMTLAQLADKCGISFQQLQRYETGENAISAYMLWSLARCLDAQPAALLPEVEAAAKRETRKTTA
jgi:transcriptional regulator with XRE-family HTH domain